MRWGMDDVTAATTRLAEVVAELPGVVVEEAYGHVGYLLTKKKFAWLLVDHHGDGRLALWVKAPAGEQEALVGADPVRYFAPPYLGPNGWVAVNVDPDSRPDWDEVAALVVQAWRMSAGKRAVAAYDDAHPGS
ncbi:MAG TPA: MmcQ/YjbR family DNA-binding protein [Actinomycetes bacterium]